MTDDAMPAPVPPRGVPRWLFPPPGAEVRTFPVVEERAERGAPLVRLHVARTDLSAGRIGHAYALDERPLGDPGAAEARGVLWRWIHHVLGEADGS